MTQRRRIKNKVLMFVTTNVANRRKIFSDPAYAREAIEVLYRVKKLHPFFLYSFVIMPDHCHFLIKVPAQRSISTIMNRFKMGVSHSLGLGSIWQARFHVKIISTHASFEKYIAKNPVSAHIVEHPEDYLWGSACGRWPLDVPMHHP
ncbi:transposase [Candidatus Peregrinibacteria bacterium]|nr:transposase [Candidatus Peregrinibacteria bacterium]